MNIENIDWQLFIIAAGFVVMKLYLSSYLKKKGENLATKEDVRLITSQVEAVRIEMEADSARVLEHENKCNEQLVTYYDYLTEFYYEFMLVNFGDFPPDDGQSLFEYQLKFGRKAVDILKQYQRLVIYLEANNEILLEGRNLSELALRSEEVMKAKITSVKRALIAERKAYITSDVDMDSYYSAVDETDVAVKEFNMNMKPLKDEFLKGYKSYLSQLNLHLNQHGKPDA
ncbi:hypothetical protein ACPDZS_003654 [Vibrio cholerae]